MERRHYCVYIMSNGTRRHVLYTGVTGDLLKRVFQHKNKLLPGFTATYNITHLVYFESYSYPSEAIAREKEIKGWRRSKKTHLIEEKNPHWQDLAKRWYDLYKPSDRESDPRQVPHSA